LSAFAVVVSNARSVSKVSKVGADWVGRVRALEGRAAKLVEVRRTPAVHHRCPEGRADPAPRQRPEQVGRRGRGGRGRQRGRSLPARVAPRRADAIQDHDILAAPATTLTGGMIITSSTIPTILLMLTILPNSTDWRYLTILDILASLTFLRSF
jgi:hypothetical protein